MAHLQIIRSSYGWDEVSLRVFPTSLLASASKTQKSLFQIRKLGCSQRSPVQKEVSFDVQKRTFECSQKSFTWCWKKGNLDAHKEVRFGWMFKKKCYLMLKKKSVQKRKMFTKKSGLDIQKEVRLECSKKEVFKNFFSGSGWTQDERTPHVYRWPFFSLCPLTTTNPPLGSSLSWGGCITISYIYHQIPLIPFAPGSAIILYEA